MDVPIVLVVGDGFACIVGANTLAINIISLGSYRFYARSCTE